MAKAIHRFEGFRLSSAHSASSMLSKLSHFSAATGRNGKLRETGNPLSKATVSANPRALRTFFLWLAGQPGYRSRMSYSDADYFRLSEKDTQIAKAIRERPAPTLEQIRSVLAIMPCATEIEDGAIAV